MVRRSTNDAIPGQEPRDLSLYGVRLRKVGFEAPDVRSISIDNIDWDKVEIHVQNEISGRRDNDYELVMVLYVNANGDNGMIFRAIVEEVGLFQVKGYPEEEISDLLRTKGAEMIYPYAREFVLSMIGRAGIPQFSLKPMTFELPDGP